MNSYYDRTKDLSRQSANQTESKIIPQENGRLKEGSADSQIVGINQITFDRLFKSGNPDTVALYCFYAYTMKWQSHLHNKVHLDPKATTSYAMKGSGLGRVRFRNAKKVLEELKLIENVKRRNEDTGKFDGWYIKVNHIQ